MASGDINIDTFKVGGIDLTDVETAHLVGFNIYEDMLSPFGPVAEARVLDHADKLGENNINGSEEVEISFSDGDGGNTRSFKFKLCQNKNLNDGTVDKSGSMKVKQYDLRMISPEMIKAQANHVQKTYNDKATSEIVKDMHKQISDKDIEVEETKKQRLQFDRDHYVDAIHKIYGRSVSSQNKSSVFAYYQYGEGEQQKYRFETFEKAFQRSSDLKFKQDATIASRSPDEQAQKQNLLWFKPSDSFFTPTRPLDLASQTTYNRETGVVHVVKKDQQNKDYKVAGELVYKEYKGDGQQKDDKKPPVYTHHSPANEKSDTGLAEARTHKAAFLSHLAQNSAEFECIGDPSITVGKCIDLDIPNKSTSGGQGNEKQFNGKALVVAVRHKIKPQGQTPRYTCVVRVVKAGYDQGGGQDG